MTEKKKKKKKKRKKRPPRQEMPRQDPKKRIENFNEVALGFTDEMALIEASRCIGCPKPKCIDGCPVLVYSRFYHIGARRKIRRSLQENKRDQCPSCYMRKGMPARNTM